MKPLSHNWQVTGQLLDRLTGNATTMRLYSARNASSGEIKLVRNAGIKDAAKADSPSVTTATNVTMGL